MKDPKGKPAPAGGFKEGGWYSGYRFLGGKFLGAGEHQPGQQVSEEVIAQTAPENVAFIQSERIKADQIQAPTQIDLPSSMAVQESIIGIQAQADQARKAQENFVNQQKQAADLRAAQLREKEKSILETDIKPLVSPFREELFEAEREKLHINENFEANQVLANELDTLLTEGNELIRQAKEVTGLAAVRNPRIQKAMDDVAARAGVIQAVLNVRNGQIAQAKDTIDRMVNYIAADRNDQIDYYNTILNLNRQDIISLDEDSKRLAQEQLNLKQQDFDNINRTSILLKEMMIDPAKAQLIGQAGVKLTDSVEEINRKLAQATYAVEVADLSNAMIVDGAQVVNGPNDVPKDELRILTDSKGKKHYFRVKEKKDGRVGTASERMVDMGADIISTNFMNFDIAVEKLANQLTLSEIYSAYMQSEMGQKYGLPKEDPLVIAATYHRAKGEITEAEFDLMIGI